MILLGKIYSVRRPYISFAIKKKFYSQFLLRLRHRQMLTVYHIGKTSCGVSEGLPLILIFSLEVGREEEELPALSVDREIIQKAIEKLEAKM